MRLNSGVKQACAALIAAATMLLVGPAHLTAQEVQVTCDAKCAAIVFGDSGKALPAAEKQAMAANLAFKAAPDGKTLIDAVCEQPVYDVQVATPDLNGDGNAEVFVLGGNTCLSGDAGSNLMLFIKNASGKYDTNLGFPAAAYEILDTKNLGYPDIKIGGPGFCFPVWRWNGKAYDFLRNNEEEPGGCEGVGQ